MAEERLEGGYADGAVRAGDTVRRTAGPWTPAVHALLATWPTTGSPAPRDHSDSMSRAVRYSPS